jgi:hypothetical protein
MHNSRALVEGSLSRGLLLFTLPILCGNVLQTVNGSVNSVWVGQFLGEAALAATYNANTVMFLLLGGVFGLAMAATILVGQNIGAGRLYEAKRVVGTSATFFALLSAGGVGRRLVPERASSGRHAHAAGLRTACDRLHAHHLSSAALHVPLRIRHGGAARRRRFEDAVLFSGAVGRARHRLESAADLWMGAGPAIGDCRLGACDLHRAGREPRGAHRRFVSPQACALPVPRRVSPAAL